MGLCLESAMRRVAGAVGCEKVKHPASEQDDDEKFGSGAFAPTGSHLDRHTVMGSPRGMNNPG